MDCPNLIFKNVSVSHEHVAQMYDGTEGWVAFRTEANRELLLCSGTTCGPRAIYNTFNPACSATCRFGWQSSSLPTYMGLSVSLMVSFPDNLELPCWSLY